MIFASPLHQHFKNHPSRTSQQGGDGCGQDVQPGKGEHLLAEVFQRGADVPDIRSVYNQEAVVTFLADMHLNQRVLAVVLLEPCIHLFQPIVDDMAFQQVFSHP